MPADHKEDRRPRAPVLRTAPWVGLGSLAGLILCALASAIVVAASHDDVVDTWAISPSVLLAIISAASNVAFGSALSTGITLHHIWDHGRGLGLFSALRAGSEARAVALMATMAYVAQFASGPLLQRSTDQIIQPRETLELLFMDLASHIPDGWLGSMEGGVSIRFRHGITQVQQNFRNDTILTRNDDGYVCPSSCQGVVKGAGLSHRCSSSTRFINLATNATDGQTVFAINTTTLINGIPFQFDPNDPAPFNPSDRMTFRLLVLHISDVTNDCNSTITVDVCDIDTAVVEYPIMIQNNTVSLQQEKLTNMNVISNSWSSSDLPTAPDGSKAGMLISLLNTINNTYSTNTTKLFKPGSNTTVYGGDGGDLADKFFLPESRHYVEGSPTGRCALTWDSPTEYLLRQMHMFVFRSALRVGNGTETQHFVAHRATVVSAFKKDRRYLGAAMGTTFCSVAFAAALMRGWWRLPRPVTLSPVETAGMLQGAVSGMDIAEDMPIKKILAILERTETGGSERGQSSGLRRVEIGGLLMRTGTGGLQRVQTRTSAEGKMHVDANEKPGEAGEESRQPRSDRKEPVEVLTVKMQR
ncbi:hypothetical protein B0H67DRAFT_558390 [Lasiosphaeris hirsuta]|uniref:Uncharacterized protein n=1 Tax=Lasiosphaeris hirsuta TaxID=260670 RepID=A0AA39ZSC3_9PEZI|nr:hypothetical protein B0H67DRAFT_558390 [Lasiosphaeris hirsuta]